MVVPPAAIPARLNADLSKIAPEVISTQRTSLNHGPETGPACCSHEPARNQSLPFSSRRHFPRHGCVPAKFLAIARCPFSLHAKGIVFSGACSRVVQEDGPRIAATHLRFYDLAGAKATPISMPAKSRCPGRESPEKAWLTFSGYQSLIGFFGRADSARASSAAYLYDRN
jgi:hypothetical protein